MADAKQRFTEAFKRPLPAIYSTVVQELLVQQHLFRWNATYQYSEVGAGRWALGSGHWAAGGADAGGADAGGAGEGVLRRPPPATKQPATRRQHPHHCLTPHARR